MKEVDSAFACQDDLEGALTPIPRPMVQPKEGGAIRYKGRRDERTSRDKGQAYPIFGVGDTDEFERQDTHNWPVEAKREPRGIVRVQHPIFKEKRGRAFRLI